MFIVKGEGHWWNRRKFKSNDSFVPVLVENNEISTMTYIDQHKSKLTFSTR